MKRVLVILLMLITTAFAACNVLPVDQRTIGHCQQFVNKGEIINAGCCYYQIEEWGDCVLHLLTGAREAEIEWDLNKGSFDAGSRAKQYYNPTFYPSSGLGSETGVCLNGYGDSALTADVTQYYNWIQFYGYGGEDEPPLDMGARIAELENELHPKAPEPESTATPTAVATADATPAPTIAPDTTTTEDNTIVMLIVAALILGVVGYFIFLKKK
ncbi:hypothetical protein ACFLQ2_05105 [archaeon]